MLKEMVVSGSQAVVQVPQIVHGVSDMAVQVSIL